VVITGAGITRAVIAVAATISLNWGGHKGDGQIGAVITGADIMRAVITGAATI